MFTSVTSLRTELETLITAAVPSSWKFRTAVADAVRATVPIVYLEFREFTTSDASGDLDHGVVSAVVDIIVTDPQTDPEDGEAAVDEHVLRVLAALDPRDDLYWDNARKERLEIGPLGWRVTVHALTSTALPE